MYFLFIIFLGDCKVLLHAWIASKEASGNGKCSAACVFAGREMSSSFKKRTRDKEALSFGVEVGMGVRDESARKRREDLNEMSKGRNARRRCGRGDWEMLLS